MTDYHEPEMWSYGFAVRRVIPIWSSREQGFYGELGLSFHAGYQWLRMRELDMDDEHHFTAPGKGAEVGVGIYYELSPVGKPIIAGFSLDVGARQLEIDLGPKKPRMDTAITFTTGCIYGWKL